MSDRDDADTSTEEPTLKQRLHAATGDREAEAEALAERADDVSLEDAELAVRQAHGDTGRGDTMAEQRHPDEALAEPSDARQVREESSS